MEGGVGIVQRRKDDNGRIAEMALDALEKACARDARADFHMHAPSRSNGTCDGCGLGLKLGRVVQLHHVTLAIRSTPAFSSGSMLTLTPSSTSGSQPLGRSSACFHGVRIL